MCTNVQALHAIKPGQAMHTSKRKCHWKVRKLHWPSSSRIMSSIHSKKPPEIFIKKNLTLFKSINRCERNKITQQTFLKMWPTAKQIIPACNERADHEGMQNEKKKLESYRSMRENHRTTEWMMLAGASGDHLIPASAQSKVNHNRLLRSASIQALKTLKDGATTTCLGELVLLSNHPYSKKVFSYFKCSVPTVSFPFIEHH